MLTLRWLKKNGGIPAIEKINNKKAKLLYDTIDSNPIYKGTVTKEDRSIMNACFVMEPELEKEFTAIAEKENFVGFKGHRTTGGFRISMYNALPYESVVAVTDVMKDFAQKKG
jgi:phosphoserine aminotransferase